MKSNMLLGLAVLGLVAVPAGVHAQSGSESSGNVSYEEAMQCSALFSLLASSMEGEAEEETLIDMATRWLVVAMTRDGTEDGSVAGEGLQSMVNSLISHLEGMESEKQSEKSLMEGAEFCDGKKDAIADEFHGIEF
jgi:hypothetical protein